MLLRSTIPRRLLCCANNVISHRHHATMIASRHDDVVIPSSSQMKSLSSLSTTASATNSSSIIRQLGTTTLFDDDHNNKLRCPIEYQHLYKNSQRHHHNDQGFFMIGGGNQHYPLQKQQIQYSQSRNFSSSSSKSNGTDVVDDEKDKAVQNNNSKGEYSSTIKADDNGQSDLGIPGAQKGGKKLAIVFTCTVCNTRSAKQFTENSYRHGVVIVQCPGCNSRHLIADNLGLFTDQDEDGWNIEKGMEKLGRQENIQVVTNDDVLELSVEDVWGDHQQQQPPASETDTVAENKESKT